jgi:NAD(P)-dependent dehydrogenase (short-subunit alcohol dehydrogenase family)
LPFGDVHENQEALAMGQSVLLTGAAGGVGQAIGAALTGAGHEVVAFDRLKAPGFSRSIVGDILDRRAVLEAAEGMDVIIHLAASPDEADFVDELLEPNVRGLYHVCDAAQARSVQKLIVASSVQVVTGHSFRVPSHCFERLIKVEDGPRVINHYALTKLWAETIGEMYSRTHNMTVIAARLGWLPRSVEHAEDLRSSAWGEDVYLSHRDAGRFFQACVETELDEGRFEILFACSKSVNVARFDLEPSRKILGYEPVDTWPEGQPFI